MDNVFIENHMILECILIAFSTFTYVFSLIWCYFITKKQSFIFEEYIKQMTRDPQRPVEMRIMSGQLGLVVISSGSNNCA